LGVGSPDDLPGASKNASPVATCQDLDQGSQGEFLMRIIIGHKKLYPEAQRIKEKYEELFDAHIEIGNICRQEDDTYTLFITNEDLHVHGKDGDWLFGYSTDNNATISICRIRGKTNEPWGVPEYEARLVHLAVHELGHCLIDRKTNPSHYREAKIYQNGEEKEDLGFHCTCPSCVMYPVFGITSKTPEGEQWMLGTEQINVGGRLAGC